MKTFFSIVLLIAFGFIMIRYDAHQARLPGRHAAVWQSPDGRTRIAERIIDDGGATVGFYKQLFIIRGENWERERIALVRMGPKVPLVRACVWRGNGACTITIHPEARFAWINEATSAPGKTMGIEVRFEGP